jgi:hypothetical protein
MKINLANIATSLFVLLTLSACQSADNNETNTNAEDGKWVSLFNGKNLNGWVPKFKNHPAGENYKDTFRVENGLLTVSYQNWENFPKNMFGHLFTDQAYSNYRLRVEYRFIGEQVTNSPKYKWAYRNNGIMLHSPSAQEMELDQEFPLSGESQLLGGNGKDKRTTGNFCSPSTNILKDGNLITAHCLTSNSKTFHGDQWVWFEIEARDDGSVKHFVNDELVFEYDELQVDPKDKYGKKWLAQGKPLKLTGGYFSLQAETHPTQFRTIEIKSLD